MTGTRFYDKHPITNMRTLCECGDSRVKHENVTWWQAFLSLFGVAGQCERCECDKYTQDKSIHYYYNEFGIVTWKYK